MFETAIVLQHFGSSSSLLTSCDIAVVTQVCHATMAGNQVQGCQYNGTGCLKARDGKNQEYVREVFLKHGRVARNMTSLL
jgi:hypothetical protein